MSASWRGIVAPVLAVLAAIALLAALVDGYASDALFSSKGFSERATAALDDDAVRAEVGRRVADDVVKAEADLVAVRPLIEEVVSGLVGAGAFQDLFRAAVADVHSSIFEGNRDSVTLTLADIGAVLRGALDALAPNVAKQIKGKADVDLADIDPPTWLVELAQLADNLAALVWILLALGILLAALALWLSADRRSTTLIFGISGAIAGVLSAVGLDLTETILLGRIEESGTRDAARGIWNAFLGDLHTAFVLFAICGAVVAAAASSLLRPVDIFAPVRVSVGWLGRVPESTGWRTVRGVALVAAGALIVIRHEAVVELAAILVGVYIAYAGVSELLRLTIAPGGEPERLALMSRGRRALLTTAIAAGAIVLAGTVFVTSGGTEEKPEAIETVGCNGALRLCDRPLDEVAFPGTHNAMSAVTNKDWLFGQQDAGFPEQLRDGIRALFIDAHYGQPTESGLVKTDLSEVGVGERDAYVEELGTEALNSALRLRDRVVDSPVTGPRQVYLCHRFCELGSISIETAFRDLRDFLAANSDEVVVVVIEDYVKPADIAAAAKESGLKKYIYEGPLEPVPTLQEIIDSDGRAVMMAERDARGVPWYHPAYRGLVQETPYSFKRTRELTDPDLIPASCFPNRGTGSAPIFLVNHWIDTSPAPKPSNAKIVNARDALMDRIRECERIRDLRANLISVDFYREGDLFEVVDELNSESP